MPTTMMNLKSPYCVQFLKDNPKEGEEFLLYMYPRQHCLANPNLGFLEQLKGVILTTDGASINTSGNRAWAATMVPTSSLGSSSNDNENEEEETATPTIVGGAGAALAVVAAAGGDDQHQAKARLPKPSPQVLHVSYMAIEGTNVLFAVILPCTRTHTQLQALAQDLFELLNFVFESLEKVVKDASQHSRLDSIFELFFVKHFDKNVDNIKAKFLKSFPMGSPYFHAQSSEIGQILSEELTNFESQLNKADYLITNDPRPCLIVGSCLFHKGILIQTHLNAEQTKHIVRYATHMNITNRKKDFPESVIIDEVFCEEEPNTFSLLKRNAQQQQSASLAQSQSQSKTKQRKRFILTILAQGETLLCSLLDVRWKISGQRNPYYIDEMRVCLQNLNSKRAFDLVAARMNDPVPPLADPTYIHRIKINKQQGSDKRKTSERPSLTDGPYNVLLQYVSYSAANATLIFPSNLLATRSEASAVVGDAQVMASSKKALANIERQFVKYSEVIREMLHMQRDALVGVNEVPLSSSLSSSMAADHHSVTSNSDSSIPFTNGGVGCDDDGGDDGTCEYGVRVQDSASFDNIVLNYWIVGRLNEDGSEFYVCYEDSIPQTVVDLAFRIGFSTLS